MGMTIRMTAALASLNRLANHPLTGWLKSVGVREQAKAGQRIMSRKKDPDQQPWAPWADSTKRHRVAKGTASRGLLHDEGLLLASLIHKADQDSVVIGTPINYGAYLQNGTPLMPAREFLGWDDVSLAKYELEAVRYLNRVI